MISRVRIICLACNKPTTARIQVGHELEQPVSFSCQHCGTEIRLTLLLDAPPHVKVRCDENCEQGKEEGPIINIGAGFMIAKDKLHDDMYFPSFDAPRPNMEDFVLPTDLKGPLLLDTTIMLGGLPQAADHWRTVQRALRFHSTGQIELMEVQLDNFWGIPRSEDKTLDNALFAFLQRFMTPSWDKWINPLEATLKKAADLNPSEFSRLGAHYNQDLKKERFESYSGIFSEYFKAYGELNQTLIYLRLDRPMPADAIATSTDFERTKMFYGNAFEVLGSHLDLPAAINNILSGRSFDKMQQMDLKQYRTINKANRTTCFSSNAELSWLVAEYDSTIRNASHHRWFKLNDSRTTITYRSGGTGAVHQLTYAEYLFRCNRLAMQLMALTCLELLLLSYTGNQI